METLDIAEVARRTGLTVRALRFYEARGLVSLLRTASGRRFYGAGELARLTAVVALKRAGFSLAEIGQLLAERRLDLGRLVAARLAEVEQRAGEIAATRALLLTVQSRLGRGEPIDVATLCSLIQKGPEMTERENWRDISARSLTSEAAADFARTRAPLPADFDQDAYAARWKDLGERIDAALPLDPASEEALAFRAEWKALIAPFAGLATSAMRESTRRMYDDMGSWQDQQRPPFSVAAMTFIKAVQAR